MKKLFVLNILAIFSFLYAKDNYKIPKFSAVPFFFIGGMDSCRVEFNISLKSTELVFIRSGLNFTGSFEISLYAFRENKLVSSHTLDTTINFSTYEETTLERRIRFKPISIVLPSSTYRFLIKALDKNSKKEAIFDTTIAIPRFGEDEEWTSSILLFEENDSLPSLNNMFAISTNNIRFYAELYNPKKGIKAAIKLYNASGARIMKPVDIHEGTLSGKIELQTLSPGTYKFQLILDDGTKKFKKEVPLYLSLESNMFIEMDFNSLLELLSYVGTNEELDSLKQACDSLRVKLLGSFWSKRDPTPNTPVNEAKEEFFERVRYANEHFSGLRDGWRTDRGRIYITYGPPDEIDSHPFDINSPPYEIWYYYTQRLKFIFVDRNNNGEYELYNTYNNLR